MSMLSRLSNLKRLGKSSRFLADLDLHSEEGCIQIFHYFDSDHDGILDNAETRRFLEKLWKQKMAAGREDIDTTQRDEFVEDLIDQLDVNDGRLSWEDLLRRRDVIIQQLGGDPEKELEEARVRRKTIEAKQRRTTRTSSFFGLPGAVKPPSPPEDPIDKTSLRVPNPARNKPTTPKASAGDRRASEWIKKHPQFAKYAPKFNFTTWDQLLEYTVADLRAMDIPGQAAVPLSKVIAAFKEEARISTSERSKSLNSSEGRSDYELDSPRPTFSYNNRVFLPESAISLDDLFEELAEGKGTIGEKEVAIALNRFGVEDSDPTWPQTQVWFNEVDRDNDGFIDQMEFGELMSLARDMIFAVPLNTPTIVDEEPDNAVFLGGSCNPTTWRQDVVIPLFKKAGISFYNPQREEWHEGLVAIEARAKAHASLLFFVIDPLTLALASMIECTELITAGRPLILVINDLPPNSKLANGDDIPPQVLKDANRARAYLADVAIRNRIQPYSSVLRAACEVIQFLHGGWVGGHEEGRSRSSTRLYEHYWIDLQKKMKGKGTPLAKTRATSPTHDDTDRPTALTRQTTSPAGGEKVRKHNRSPSLGANPGSLPETRAHRTKSLTPNHIPTATVVLPPPPNLPPPPSVPPPVAFIPPPSTPPPAQSQSSPSTPPVNIPPPPTPPPATNGSSTVHIPPPPTPPPNIPPPTSPPPNIPPPNTPPPYTPVNIPPPNIPPPSMPPPHLGPPLEPPPPLSPPLSPHGLASPSNKKQGQEWAAIIRPPPLPPPPPLPLSCLHCNRLLEPGSSECSFCVLSDDSTRPPSPRSRKGATKAGEGESRHLASGDFSGVGSDDVLGDYSGLGTDATVHMKRAKAPSAVRKAAKSPTH